MVDTVQISEYTGDISCHELNSYSGIALSNSGPETVGMNCAMGTDGQIVLQPGTLNGTTEEAFNDLIVPLSTVESSPLVSLTTLYDYTNTGDSAFEIKMTLSNTDKKTVDVTLKNYSDDVLVATLIVTVPKNTANFPIVVNRLFLTNVVAGSVLTITATAASDGVLTVEGGSGLTQVTLFKSASPLVSIKNYIASNEGKTAIGVVTYNTSSNLPNGLDRSDIDAILLDNNVTLTTDAKFYIVSNDSNMFFVTYNLALDICFYVKLNAAN